MGPVGERPLLSVFPALAARTPWVTLAELPTPVQALPGALASSAFVKRDDLTSHLYGYVCLQTPAGWRYIYTFPSGQVDPYQYN